jgi:hypothetical protein
MSNQLSIFTDPFAPVSNITRKNDNQVGNWCDKMIKRSQAYLRTNIAWPIADTALLTLLGKPPDEDIIGNSDIRINKNRRILREGIANKSNFRPRWGFQTGDYSDEKAKKDVKQLDALLESWWINRFVDRVLRGALQYADGAGTGYVELEIDIDPNTGEYEIIPSYRSHKDVLVIHPTSDLDLQRAKAVAIRHEMTLPEFRAKFPNQSHLAKADRNQPSWIYKTAVAIGDKVGLHVRDIVNRDKADNSQVIFPTIDVWYVYIQDDTINYTKESIVMGSGDNSYLVPSYFDENGKIRQVTTNVKKQNSDDFETQDIDVNQCKLYPERRRVIWVKSGVVKDEPSPYWGNMAPVVQFKTDDIVGQFLGLPANYDAASLEKGANSLLRACIDSTNGKLAPPMGVDSRIPKEIAKAFSMRRSVGQKFRYNILALSKAFVPLVSPDYYNWDAKVIDLVERILGWMDYLSGTSNPHDLMSKNQIPGQDTQEALIQSISPLASDQMRGIEHSLLKLGMIWKPMAFQTYTYKKRLTILGKNNKLEAIDYDPNSLVPLTTNNDDERPRWMRAKEYMNKFYFYAAPNSLHQRESITKQLQLFQMKKLMVPVTDKKIYETTTGETDYDIMEEEYYEQETRKAITAAKIQANVQLIMQQIQSAQNPLASILAMAQGQNGGGNGNGQIPALQNNNPVGRPATFSGPPQQEAKTDQDGIPRGTITS